VQCKLQWHPNGDFLAAKVDRTTKTKKSSYVSFEIFRIREKDIPVEILDLKGTAKGEIATFFLFSFFWL